MKVCFVEVNWSLQVGCQPNRLGHCRRHSVRLCRVIFDLLQPARQTFRNTLEVSPKLWTACFDFRTQLLNIFIAFRSKILDQLNETILFSVKSHGKCVRSQHIHIPYFACTLSNARKVTQKTFNLSVRSEVHGNERSFEASRAGSQIVNGIRRWPFGIFAQELHYSAR